MHGAVDRRGGDLNAREIRLLLLYVAQLSLGMDNGGKITPLVIVSQCFGYASFKPSSDGNQPLSSNTGLEINDIVL